VCVLDTVLHLLLRCWLGVRGIWLPFDFRPLSLPTTLWHGSMHATERIMYRTSYLSEHWTFLARWMRDSLRCLGLDGFEPYGQQTSYSSRSRALRNSTYLHRGVELRLSSGIF
jgi:hypothetical protein